MCTGEQIPPEIDRHLREAIARLQKDVATIEMWAAAVRAFSQPVPDYQPSNDNLLPSLRRDEAPA